MKKKHNYYLGVVATLFLVISCTNTNYSILNVSNSQNKSDDELYKDFLNNRNNTFYQKYKNKLKSSDNNPIVKIDTSFFLF